MRTALNQRNAGTLVTVRERVRGWWPLFVVALMAVAASSLLYVVWRSPQRTNLATYGAFALPVVLLVGGRVAWARQRAARVSGANRVADGAYLDRVADRLATAVHGQWDKAAIERELTTVGPITVTWRKPSLPLAGSLAAAASSRRFAPLPGLEWTEKHQLEKGRISDLHAAYGGLGSGRLVIAGPPGSGKTGTAILLVLAALQYRDQAPVKDRPKIPVPVLVTARDWDPGRQPVADWLARQLREDYPLFTGTMGAANAARLIDGGKIALILDGLDEIAPELRPIALQALSRQATFRVVILSRTAEMASAAVSDGGLRGAAAIELRAIDADEAARYLERVPLDPPPGGWHDLITRIRTSPESPLARSLDSPLTLTLVGGTYQSGDDVRELMEFCDTTQVDVASDHASKVITDYLLDRVLPAAYAPRPGKPPPPYDLPTALNALSIIAARMTLDGTRDLQWWRVPEWVPIRQHYEVSCVVAGLPSALVVGLGVGFSVGLTTGIVAAAVAFVAGGLTAGLRSGGGKSPHRMGRPRIRRMLTRSALGYGLVAGLAGGAVAIQIAGLKSALVGGLVAAFVAALGISLGAGLADPDSTTSLSPIFSWHNDRDYSVAVGLGVGLLVGLGSGIAASLMAGVRAGIGVGVGVALAGAFVAGIAVSRVWPSALASIQLAGEWRIPICLIRFLDDARERNVLRTVGPVYQFRHAQLQDRLITTLLRKRDEANRTT